ncbi:uncharacterized protein YALI1_C14641g [Yarrowia lipolytica]|uniref:Uncharacterized protein n=1 Tax=Yarrowia lipolytica TaxID=4952 RepID=A0A1D8NAH0_YARLL|nr:hypothetical protein YALI1_C14641g [Yarrowia lipolytica]
MSFSIQDSDKLEVWDVRPTANTQELSPRPSPCPRIHFSIEGQLANNVIDDCNKYRAHHSHVPVLTVKISFHFSLQGMKIRRIQV